jgi:photosystem II stability/assembly factor-like uncharacterized protein
LDRTLRAAALCCGLVLFAGGAIGKEVLPDSGPLGENTAKRLALLDAANLGNRIVAVGDRGYIVYSDDAGSKWTRAKAPPAPLLTAISFADAKNGWAVGHDSVILATQDGGLSWTQQFSAAAEQRPLLDVLFLDAKTGIAVGAYGAYYETSDGGKTWNAAKATQDDKHLNAIIKVADVKLLILGEAGTILLSDDAGKKWTAVPSPYKGSLFGGVVADDGAIVAFGLRGRIYRSTDAGKTWKQVDTASQVTLMGGTKLPDGAIVLAGAAGTALVSRDNGQSFQPLPSGTTRALASAILGGPNAVLLLGEAGARSVALPSAPKR